MKKAPVLETDILILGGGLTGLSTAFHLEKAGYTDYLLVEKNDFFGGLSASIQKQGFTFDYSGHLLHLRNPYAMRLVRRLLGKNLAKIKREAFIYFEQKRVPFPFQANLWALTPQARQECLQGALEAAQNVNKKPKNFEQWCLRAFGQGIYHHFMRPYNLKLWQTDPSKLTCDWCGPFVPEPNIAQIRRGACQKPRQSFGYNHSFYYPQEGGCGALAQALAQAVPNTWLQAGVQKIDFKKKQAQINGQTLRFKRLVNTLPLKDLIRLSSAPASIKAQARKLKHTTVEVLNFAIKRTVEPFHWMYFPQEDTPFYRVGLQSRFSPHNAPAGTSAFYVETAQKITDRKSAEKAIFQSLIQKGIINKQDKILLSFWQTLPVAYSVYDTNRAPAVNKILRWLSKNHCFCGGRYGLWEYSFMERSLLQGREIAEKLL